ncbi:MAG: DUF4035 domain-containing protein [Candidatus Hydrogenedentes bacterium]|nr:DUF4035 domain-containing protein [Candidatus Hydrogenedentota bacterium]
MKNELDSQEFALWMAYYAIQPWGEQRGDLRNAIVAATVANSNPYRKGRNARVDEFMPFADTRGREMTDEEMMREVERGFAMITGK